MLTPRRCRWLVVSAMLALAAGCASEKPSAVVSPGGESGVEKARSADVSILFVGNSHTTSHNLPDLIGDMIRFRHPEKTVYSHVVGVGFLEDVARDPTCKEEITSRPWKFVVLQAQKESKSGRFAYSTAEGIDVAKLGKTRGATVYYFAEWGLKAVADHGRRIEAIYQKMADDAGVGVAPVGRAWDLALAARPDLQLHAADGNHQTALGAFLTACVLVGRLTGESPAPLASFPYPAASEADRKFLEEVAAKALTASDAGVDKD